MTEKRFVKGYHTIRDIKENNVYDFQVNIMCDLLNEQSEQITELKERNQRQYERLKQIGDLMLKRDWKTLENMVEDWEKADELLQAEWGTYCENE